MNMENDSVLLQRCQEMIGNGEEMRSNPGYSVVRHWMNI